MRFYPFHRRAGFSLAEVMVATTLFVLVGGMAFTGFIYLLKKESINTNQTALDMDVRKAAERIKALVRLSALDRLVFYPADTPNHQSISIPLPGDTTGDGLMDTDADGNILYRSTAIYHPWPPNAPAELRLTTFSPRDNSLTAEQRYTQLARVVQDGHGRDAANGSNSVTLTIFRNLFDWRIRPYGSIYDGYAPQKRRDGSVTLGTATVNPGTNSISFRIVGKDAASTNFFARLDTLSVTPSQLPREAENLVIAGYSGGQPVKDYEANGFWSANHQLRYPGTAVNQSFTLVFENDCWEKVTFREVGDTHENTDVIFEASGSPRQYALCLAGMSENWSASSQTGDNTVRNGTFKELNGVTVRVLLRGHEMPSPGFSNTPSAGCRVQFTNGNTGGAGLQKLSILKAYIAESAGVSNATPNIIAGTSTQLFFQDSLGAAVPGVTLDADQSVWTTNCTFAIDPSKTYAVTYRVVYVDASHPHVHAPRVWQDIYTNVPSSYLYPSAAESELTRTDWSAVGTVVATAAVYSVQALFGLYAPEGVFVSQIIDTHMTSPPLTDLAWVSSVPSGTTLELKLRTGEEPDLSDAPAWSNGMPVVTSPELFYGSLGDRYLQLYARLVSNPGGTLTPKLHSTKLRWVGPRRMVDIGGVFTRAPDSGRFEVRVNGTQLKTGVVMDMEVYRDIRGFSRSGSQRLRSAVVAEISPRNSRLVPE